MNAYEIKLFMVYTVSKHVKIKMKAKSAIKIGQTRTQNWVSIKLCHSTKIPVVRI